MTRDEEARCLTSDGRTLCERVRMPGSAECVRIVSVQRWLAGGRGGDLVVVEVGM
jgi:hypothetical protein